ncbi:hypothetical protein STCU_04771 [Strigomonas culicis]|nr:hypothetical protein STCU_04771 [Strigomonas culicis]|eukprot:EPY29008.1 hypothetical protein STCU_04771 [Strigomonas culicis]
MCHGGYFAGGVFVNNKCITHKSFQRYVVRKKQGGKQSSNAKDGGGSYNSVGSQIRAAQEIKWRIDVCHILSAWRSVIEASHFIFYVAPGPQNVAVLTDFSSLPSSAQTSQLGASPVSLTDPRVRKVPLTTHRPNFEEVQRIYAELSQCHVSYCIPRC